MKYTAGGYIDKPNGIIDIYENYEFDDETEAFRFGMNERINQFCKMRVNTQEKLIREGLIKLGWTPPPEEKKCDANN